MTNAAASRKRWDAAHPEAVRASKKRWNERHPEVFRRHTQEKSRQLGMNFSTASSRLKKSVVFSMIQQLQRDTCLRCGELILTPEDLTYDHIKDWLHVDASLFWDLDNIAFSHRKCNTRKFVVSEVDKKDDSSLHGPVAEMD